MSAIVRVLMVSSATTLGHAASEAALMESLQRSGCDVHRITPTFFRLPRRLHRPPLTDLAEALALTRVARREFRRLRPDVVLYTTTTSAYLEPASHLRIGVLRFDALAAENRRGLANVPQRMLERRAIGRVRLYIPFSDKRNGPRRQLLGDRAVIIPLAVPIDPEPGVEDVGHRDELEVLCYGGNPGKKGLDIVARAWASAERPPAARLVVAGLSVDDAHRYFAENDLPLGAGVEFVGVLPQQEFRRRLARAGVFLSASRYEDFGIVQLEALQRGTYLVSVPSDGPYEALAILRQIAPEFVADDITADALAKALQRAFAVSPLFRDAYQAAASEAVAPFTRTALDAVCRDQILPELVHIAHS